MTTSVLFCVFLALTLVHGQPWVPAPRTDQAWVTRFEQNVANSRNNAANINVLFYGDSIVDGWRGQPALWEQSFGRHGAANYGIGGDGCQHVLWRIIHGETDGINPRIVVVKIGTNNLGSSDPDVARGVSTIVEELRTRLPHSRILLLGILPRTNSAVTARVHLINGILSANENANSIRFLDIGDEFYYDRVFFAERFSSPDLLHLSAAGYVAWDRAMAELFNEMWNSSSLP